MPAIRSIVVFIVRVKQSQKFPSSKRVLYNLKQVLRVCYMCRYVPSCMNVIAEGKLQRCSACVGHETGYEILPWERHECLLGAGDHCLLEMKACARAVNCDTVYTCGTYRAVTMASVLSVRGENIDISTGGSEGTTVHVRTVGL